MFLSMWSALIKLQNIFWCIIVCPSFKVELSFCPLVEKISLKFKLGCALHTVPIRTAFCFHRRLINGDAGKASRCQACFAPDWAGRNAVALSRHWAAFTFKRTDERMQLKQLMHSRLSWYLLSSDEAGVRMTVSKQTALLTNFNVHITYCLAQFLYASVFVAITQKERGLDVCKWECEWESSLAL